MHNQLLTLAFMVQLVIAAIQFGFLVAKISSMAQSNLDDSAVQQVIFTVLLTLVFTVAIISFCQQAAFNFFDKRILLIAFASIWIPQIIKDLGQKRQARKDRMYAACLTVQVNLTSVFVYSNASLIGLQPDNIFLLQLFTLILAQFICEGLLLRYNSPRF